MVHQNGHAGKDRSHFEMEHGGHGYGQLNPEEESILSFAQAYTLVVANTHFQSKDEHLITCKSGDRCWILQESEKVRRNHVGHYCSVFASWVHADVILAKSR